MAIKQALEQQRKMYEEKFEKLLISQSLRPETTVSHNINQNRYVFFLINFVCNLYFLYLFTSISLYSSNVPKIPQNPANSSIGPLYPNLNVMTNNTISNRQAVYHDLHENHPSVLNTYEFQ